MAINWLAVLVTALVPTVLGFIWYHKKVFGTAWMKAADMTDEKINSGNMPVVFGISLILSILLALSMTGVAVHQNNLPGLFVVDGQFPATGTEGAVFLEDFMAKYGTLHRTFTHGLVHGLFAGIMFALPILATNGLFERKSAKYILINAGYWIVTISIMAGIICAWV